MHLVFSTKQREPLLLRPVRGRVRAYLATDLKNLDSPARKIGGMSDHVHILFRMSKDHALAEVAVAMGHILPPLRGLPGRHISGAVF